MSHLIEEYAKNLGVKISKPIVVSHFWPLKYEKFITICLDTKTPAKNYKYYDIVVDMVRNVLDSKGIKIIQIGSSQCSKLQNVDDRIFDLTFKQFSYIVSRSSGHVGVDNVLSHYASSVGVPLVTLFGNVYSDVSKGFWSKSAINIEAPWKVKPCLNSSDPDNSINKIAPEEIGNAILKQLGIGGTIPLKTKFIGEFYENQIIEVVPNYFIPDEEVRNKHIFLRPDLGESEDFLIQWMVYLNQFSVFSRREISPDFLANFSGKLKGVSYIVGKDSSISEEHLKSMQTRGISVSLLVEDEDILPEVRENFFDFDVHLYFKSKKSALDGLEINFEKTLFNSSKIILANGRQYVSKYHFLKDQNFVDKNFVLEDNEALLEELNHLYLYERTR